MEFATTETEVHQADITAPWLPIAQELVSSITNKVIQAARLSNVFSDLYPLVRTYVAQRCFGATIDIESDTVRGHLNRLEIQEAIAKYLARAIGKLTIEEREIEFDKANFKLSDTRPFLWRRNLPPLQATKTIFNFVASYNPFEREFAEFLDRKENDVIRFASLGTTEQGESGSQFRIDYLKPSGAIGFYHPDWVVVQKTGKGEVNWIIETKGRKWEGTEEKDLAMSQWCERITERIGKPWRFTRINQVDFNREKPTRLADFVEDKDQLL
jgi:type III restriction enzyme